MAEFSPLSPVPAQEISPPPSTIVDLKRPVPERIGGGAPTFRETQEEIKKLEQSSGITDRQRRALSPADYSLQSEARLSAADFDRFQDEVAVRNEYMEQVGEIKIRGDDLFKTLEPRIISWYSQLRGQNLDVSSIDIISLRQEIDKLRKDVPKDIEMLLDDFLVDDAQSGAIEFYIDTALSQIESNLVGQSRAPLPFGYDIWSVNVESIEKRVEAMLSQEQGKGWYLTEYGLLRLRGSSELEIQEGIDNYLKYKESRATGLKPDAIFSELQKIDDAIDIATSGLDSEVALRIKYLSEGKLLAFMSDIFNLDTNQGNFDGLVQVLDAFCSVGKEEEKTRDGFRERMNALFRSYGGKTARAVHIRQASQFIEYGRPEGLQGLRRDPAEQSKHKEMLKWEMINMLAGSDIREDQVENVVYAMSNTDFDSMYNIDPQILARAVDPTTGRFTSDTNQMFNILKDVLGSEEKAKKRMQEAQEAFVLSERMLKMWGWTARELGPRIWATEKRVRNTTTNQESIRNLLVNEFLPPNLVDLGTVFEGYKLFDDIVAERVQEEIDKDPDKYPPIPTYNISLTADSTARWSTFGSDDEIAAQKKLAEVWKLYHREWDKLITDCRKTRRHIEIARGPLFYKQAFYLPFTYDRTVPLEPGGKIEQLKTNANKDDFASEAIADELSYYCQLGIRSLGDEFGWRMTTVTNSRTGLDEEKMVFGSSTLRDIMGRINRSSLAERAALGTNLRGKDVSDWIATLKGYKDQKSLIKGGAVGNSIVPGLIVNPIDKVDSYGNARSKNPMDFDESMAAIQLVQETAKPYLDVRSGYGNYLNIRWPAIYPSDEISDLVATHYVDFICDSERASPDDGQFPVEHMRPFFGRSRDKHDFDYLKWIYKHR